MENSSQVLSSPVAGGVPSGAPPFFTAERRKSTFGTLHQASDLFKDYDDRMCVIVGSGPSLQEFPFDQLDRPWIYSFGINHEPWRNMHLYTPNAWIFFDWGVARQHDMAKECPLCPGGMIEPPVEHIFTRQQIVQDMLAKSRWLPDAEPEQQQQVPPWLHRAYTFAIQQPWSLGCGRAYMRRTTATAALTLAVQMGFKHIALLGIDMFTRKKVYYYTGLRPSQKPSRNKTALGDDRYAEDRHLKMMADFTHVSQRLKAAGWDGHVYQCSLRSPMSCFEKVPYEVAIHRYGR